MKKALAIFMVVFASLACFMFTTEYIIYEDAATSSNDSLESQWKDVGDKSHVELFINIDDTCRFDYYIDYRTGTDKEVTIAVDSIKSTGTSSTSVSKGVVLKGFGASGIVNLIPGAREIRVRGYRFVGAGAYASEATNSFHVNLSAW